MERRDNVGSYLDCLEELFLPTKERTFTNRTSILNMLNEALTKFNEGTEPYQVVSIHGIGGIGKTRLVKEFRKILSPEPIIYTSFEIEKRCEVINNLYQIRTAITSSCPFFDYALLRYWEMTNPSSLNENFMLLFRKEFFLNMFDLIAETLNCSSSFLKKGIPIPDIVSPAVIIDFMNSLYLKIPQLLHNDLFEAISNASSEQLAYKLPTLLGIEIKQLIVKGKITHPVFIFDSYQESQPYSESEEWLFHLVNAIGQGLFIITSREPLHWNIKCGCLILHHLKCYPVEDARELLEETIIGRNDLVDVILTSTQCVPIYIDLALNVYENEKSIVGDELVSKALFLDRHKLVHHFINHFKSSWQSVILDLATIRVFNYDIFEHLVKQRILDCASYEYATIIKSNLFNYVSESTNSSLVKLHDVFCKDVQMGREIDECYTIYKSYLEYLCYRRDAIIQENTGAVLAALFQNALYLAIVFEERMSKNVQSKLSKKIEKAIVENLLDIFFTLTSNRIRFEPLPFDNIKTETMRNVCQFVYAKTYEKVNTLKTIDMLEKIADPTCFGKHKISYEAVLFYAKSLAGHYDKLEAWTNKIDQKLDERTKSEWFYNRIKIYQADCDMMRGRFKSAQQSLVLLKNNFNSIEDHYSINRTIGHIQRFNFLLDDAYAIYSALMKQFKHNTVFREYLAANLAETQCYFPNSNFIKRTKKVLNSIEVPYNVKNKGKVLYSLAIANTVKKHYYTAQKNIDNCIKINQEDGYQSGILFAYMAQAYLDYSIAGVVSEKTTSNIESLLLKNNVYEYFRLPLAIIKEDAATIYQIKNQYEWIDFNQTELEYRRFLAQLRHT